VTARSRKSNKSYRSGPTAAPKPATFKGFFG
jgi:hypothetical protein